MAPVPTRHGSRRRRTSAGCCYLETRVSRRIPEFIDFLAKLGGEMIVKPLGGKGGEGVGADAHGDLLSVDGNVRMLRRQS